MMAKTIVFTVTNDLNTDQRMIRICGSLANAGYDVLLIGRKSSSSLPLTPKNFRQKRLTMFSAKGFLFYAEYNTRLFFYLLTLKMHAICAIDLDTILPCYLVSRLRKTPRIYDAHELFCEMKEIATRPRIYNFWKKIERFTVPAFVHGYTVNKIIADEFAKMYGVRYEVVRSIAPYRDTEVPEKKEKFIIYQGAVNEGRCFETLIPAMRRVDATLVICGNGNFMDQALDIVKKEGLEQKVIFRGRLLPRELLEITAQAYIGVTLFDRNGLSNYYSLANRFFDYIHSSIPQICVDYPAYREINNLYHVAVLIEEPDIDSIAVAINSLLSDTNLYNNLQEGCQRARKELNWQHEEKKLIAFYKKVLGNN